MNLFRWKDKAACGLSMGKLASVFAVIWLLAAKTAWFCPVCPALWFGATWLALLGCAARPLNGLILILLAWLCCCGWFWTTALSPPKCYRFYCCLSLYAVASSSSSSRSKDTCERTKTCSCKTSCSWLVRLHKCKCKLTRTRRRTSSKIRQVLLRMVTQMSKMLKWKKAPNNKKTKMINSWWCLCQSAKASMISWRLLQKYRERKCRQKGTRKANNRNKTKAKARLFSTNQTLLTKSILYSQRLSTLLHCKS